MLLLLGILAAAAATIGAPRLQGEKGPYLLQWHIARTRAGEVNLTSLAKQRRMDPVAMARKEVGFDVKVKRGWLLLANETMKLKVLFARVFRPPACLALCEGSQVNTPSASAAHLKFNC